MDASAQGARPARTATTLDDEAQLPPWGVVAAAMLAVAIAAAAAVAIAGDSGDLVLKADGFAVFAPIYVVAQAIERALEPIASRVLAPNEEKDEVKEAREVKLRVTEVARAMALADPTAVGSRGLLAPTSGAPDVAAAGDKEQAALHRLRRKRSIRKLVWWAAASVLALLVTGWLDLGIIEAMVTEPPLRGDQHAVDIVLTGLVIGAGTKPLHDLIVRLEKGKDNADPATKPTEKVAGTPPAGR